MDATSRWSVVFDVLLAGVLAAVAIGLPLHGLELLRSKQSDYEHLEHAAGEFRHAIDIATTLDAGLRACALVGVGTKDCWVVSPGLAEDFDVALAKTLDHLHDRPGLYALVEQIRPDFARLLVEGGVGAGGLTSHEMEEASAELTANSVVAEGALEEAMTEAKLAIRRAKLDFAALVGLGLAAVALVVGMLALQRIKTGATHASLEAVEHRLVEIRERLASERRLNLETREALSVASHDLSNPITGLLIASDLLLEEIEEAGNHRLGDLANEMNQACRRAALLAGDLLDFTRLDAGRLVSNLTAFRPGAVAEDAIGDVHLWNRTARVDLFDQLRPSLLIRADHARIRGVLRNLLENALKYGQPPYRLRLVFGRWETVEFHVEDSGPGVPEEEREEIFERFQRGSTSTGKGGTGLGLFLARRFAEAHGGCLWLTDSVLGGSDFVLQIPASPKAGGRDEETWKREVLAAP